MIEDNHQYLLNPWKRVVNAAPEACALIEATSGRQWSFRSIDDWSRTLAEGLQPYRLKGLPVAFQQANGGAWVARFLALLRVGAAALPLDPSTPAQGFRELAVRCGAVEWNDEKKPRMPTKPRRFRDPVIALVKLTSGTTGEPRSLPFRAGELAADGRQVMRGMKIGAGDRNLAIIPFGHSYGLGNLIMPLLLAGVPVVCGSSPLPHILATEFAEGKANILPAVPAMFHGLVRAGAPLPGLRLAITAGAPLPPEVARGFLDQYGQPLHNFLGSSESGGIAFDAEGEAGLTGRGVGRPLPRVSIDFDRRGRLIVSSPAVFTRGNRLASEGLGRVILGDRGAFNTHGELVLSGRARSMIKVGARRLDPLEVERALKEIEGVRAAWATDWSSGGETRPAAVAAANLNAAEIRATLRLRLPAWKIPRPLVVVPELPLTTMSKPDRKALIRILREATATRKVEGNDS